MTDEKEQTDALDKSDSQHRLIAAINGIRAKMAQCHRSRLDDYRNVVPRWSEGRHIFPGTYPEKDRCPDKRNIRGVVLYDVGLTVARFWNLMLTDETVGLSQLLVRLEYYAAHGWDHLGVVGDASQGYWLQSPKEKP